jgi:hypothetical protein
MPPDGMNVQNLQLVPLQMSVNVYQTTRQCSLEHSHLHGRRHEKLKTYKTQDACTYVTSEPP